MRTRRRRSQPIVDAYAHAIHVVFLTAVPVAGLAFVLSLFLKEVPLRGTSRAAAADVGEGFGMPEGADSLLRLQTAIARIVRTRGPEAAREIREASGTALDVADGWCVGQVHIRERVSADTSLQAIGRRVRVPAQVLKPAFDTARDDGYLRGDDDRLQVTDAGEREIQKLVTATHDWLAAELADWGAQDDALLTRALDDMARQFIDQDPNWRLPCTSRAPQCPLTNRGESVPGVSALPRTAAPTGRPTIIASSSAGANVSPSGRRAARRGRRARG